MSYNNSVPFKAAGGRGYGGRSKGDVYGPQLPYKRRSGAKRSRNWIPTSGVNKGRDQYQTRGWKMAGKDLISVVCTTTSKSQISPKGFFGNIACNVTNTNTGESNLHWGSMEKSTGKVYIDGLNWVVSPKGSFCGQISKR